MKKILETSIVSLLCFSLPFIVFFWFIPFNSSLIIGNDYSVYSLSSQIEAAFSILNKSFPLYSPGFANGHSSAALTLGQLFHPIFYVCQISPEYWEGYALEWNTLFRFFSLGLVHFVMYQMLRKLSTNIILSLVLSFITVYNLRMLDMFRYGASLENYLAFLLLACTMVFYYFEVKLTTFLALVFSSYLLAVGGHPQIMYLSFVASILIGLLLPFILPEISKDLGRNKANIIKFYLYTIFAILVGVLLASVYLIPFYVEFLTENALRVGRNYEWSTGYSDNWSGTLNNFFAPLKSDVHGAFGSSSLIILVILIPLLKVFKIQIPKIILTIWSLIVLTLLCSIGSDTPIHYIFWKYFPLAQSFRTPGRVNLILPFLFLLILVWLFNNKTEFNRKLNNKNLLILSTASFFLHITYNLWIIDFLPASGKYTPTILHDLAHWINITIFLFGIELLILIILSCFKNRTKYYEIIIYSLIFINLIFQITLELRYGTWIKDKKTTTTYDQIAKNKFYNINFTGNPGFGMTPTLIIEQEKLASLQNKLAQFYTKYQSVASEIDANQIIKSSGISDTAIIESFTGEQQVKEEQNINNKIRLTYSSFNKLIFDTSTQSSGFFVLNYFYDKRWKAFINDKEAKTYKTNGYETGIFVPSGHHTIEFKRWSPSYMIGMAISLSTLGFLGIFTIYFSNKNKIFIIISSIVWIGVCLNIYFIWYDSLYTGTNLNVQYFWESKDLSPRVKLPG